MAVFIHFSIQHAIEVFVHSYRHVDRLDANDCGGAQINRQTLALSTFGDTYIHHHIALCFDLELER